MRVPDGAASSSFGARFAFAIYLAVALLYAGPGLLPGRVLIPLDLSSDIGAWKPDPNVRVAVSNALLSDVILQFRPWEIQARRSLATGRVPWTNPYSGEGTSLFANPAAALFSPFTWIRLWLGDRGWAWSVLLKLLVAGMGARGFARRLGAQPRAAFASGLVYMLSGYSILWALHPQTNVFAFLPWLGSEAYGLLLRPSARGVGGVVLFAALATAGGHPETLAFGVTAIALFLAFEWRRASRSVASGTSGTSPGLVSCAAASGFLLLSFQLVPFLLILRDSRIAGVRSQWSRQGLLGFGVAGQVLPGFLGSPLAGEVDLSGAFVGSANLHMRSEGFVGVVALLAIALAARRLPSALRHGLIVSVLALAVAWGIPPLPWLWLRVPVVSLFAREYAASAFVLFAAMAFGPALDLVTERTRFLRAAVALVVFGGLMLVVAGVLPSLEIASPAIESATRKEISRLRERGHLTHPTAVYEARLPRYLERLRWTAIRRAAAPGFMWILGGLALCSRRRRALVPLAAFGELFAFGWGYLPAIAQNAGPGPAPAIAAIQSRRPGMSAMVAAAREAYPPDLATVDRLRDVRAYEYLEGNEWASRLLACGYDENARAFPEDLTVDQESCLARNGVRYYLARNRPPGAGWIGGGAPPAVAAYELPSAVLAPPPNERAPRGLAAGVLLSLAAAVAAVVLFRAARRD